MQIITSYSPWLVLLCFLVGALYSFLLYGKDKKLAEFSSWLLYLLAILRFSLVSILCILLLAPLLQNLTKKLEEPIIIIAQDNSSSILLSEDSGFYQTGYKESLDRLSSQLSAKYDVEVYTFGENIHPASNNLNFSEKFTNISQVFQEVEDRFSNRNLGGLIIASDGIYNQGSNPIYSTQGWGFPIYSIAMGDTTARIDLLVKNVQHNQIAYFGNRFPVVMDITALKLAGKSFNLQILKDGEILFEERILADTDDYFTSVSTNLTATQKGLQKYTVQLSTIDGEVSYNNNSKDFYINILDGRQRILILANSPHPDIKALKETLEKNENYEVIGSLVNDFNAEYSDFDLVILHQLPSNNHHLNELLKNSDGESPNLFIFIGAQSNIALLNNSQMQLNISGSTNRLNEVQAVVEGNFPLFKLSEDFAQTLGNLPPVHSPFGKYSLDGQNYVLLSQKVGMVSTAAPLLYFQQEGEKKIGVFTAEGLWKWKMVEYAQNQNTEIFEELIGKSVQYLALKSDQSFFRLTSDNEFFENEPVIFDAELYNSSYELINEPEVEITIKDEEGKSYPYTFSRVSNAYTLNTGILPVGEYTYEARVELAGETMTETGQFSVKEIQIEDNNTVANHQLLYQLAQNTNGGFFYPDELEKLYQTINDSENLKPISYLQEETKEVIHLKWIFFLLLSLLSLEWFLRKRNGAY